MSKKPSKKWIIILIAIVVIGGIFGYKYWKSRQSALPAGIASGNGRIEAKLTDASAKEALRVEEVLVDEGDLVRRGQVVVRLDTSTMDAELAKDEAAVAAAKEEFAAATAAIAAAKAAVMQQEGESRLAQIEADRQSRLFAENATSQALLDIRKTAVETGKSAITAAKAQADAAQSRADAAQMQIKVALAGVERTKSRIKDATLVSPVDGRVLYRLVEPGEVLGPGGKALTIVNLKDVYMEIFLPADQVAPMKIGEEARITVDYEPNASAAAYVSFVSPEAQFTPKYVETKSEREKLMFRVKIQVPEQLVQHYIERIKTGERGVGYVKVNAAAKWPAWLEKDLLNPSNTMIPPRNALMLQSPSASSASK
jgi:HlyD family secretion protein